MKAWLSKPARVRARMLAGKQQGRGTAPAVGGGDGNAAEGKAGAFCRLCLLGGMPGWSCFLP